MSENNQDSKYFQEVAMHTPMGRMVMPDEYHGSLMFLLSDASSYITGAVITADGGRTAW